MNVSVSPIEIQDIKLNEQGVYWNEEMKMKNFVGPIFHKLYAYYE